MGTQTNAFPNAVDCSSPAVEESCSLAVDEKKLNYIMFGSLCFLYPQFFGKEEDTQNQISESELENIPEEGSPELNISDIKDRIDHYQENSDDLELIPVEHLADPENSEPDSTKDVPSAKEITNFEPMPVGEFKEDVNQEAPNVAEITDEESPKDVADMETQSNEVTHVKSLIVIQAALNNVEITYEESRKDSVESDELVEPMTRDEEEKNDSAKTNKEERQKRRNRKKKEMKKSSKIAKQLALESAYELRKQKEADRQIFKNKRKMKTTLDSLSEFDAEYLKDSRSYLRLSTFATAILLLGALYLCLYHSSNVSFLRL